MDGDRDRVGSGTGRLVRAGPPDILYHACTEDHVQHYLREGAIRTPTGRPVFLSDDESQAFGA